MVSPPPYMTPSGDACRGVAVWSEAQALGVCRVSGHRLEWEAPGKVVVGRVVVGGPARAGASVAVTVGVVVSAGSVTTAWPCAGLAVGSVGMTAVAGGLVVESVGMTAGSEA